VKVWSLELTIVDDIHFCVISTTIKIRSFIQDKIENLALIASINRFYSSSA